MNLFNQLFRNEIGIKEKWQWLGLLGLDAVSFIFEEKIQEKTLRVVKVEKGHLASLPPLLKKSEGQRPDIILRHQELFPVLEVEKKSSLSDELLPHPWAILFTKNIAQSSQLIFCDGCQKASFDQIRDAFESLERIMSRYELSFMVSESLGLVFVFHFVRGQLHQAGMVSLVYFEQTREKIERISCRAAPIIAPLPNEPLGFPFCFRQLQETSKAF